ncbi:hypothetical protein PTKIN_Ptkin13bG0268200 [Pterospermum kingtungense]
MVGVALRCAMNIKLHLIVGQEAATPASVAYAEVLRQRKLLVSSILMPHGLSLHFSSSATEDNWFTVYNVRMDLLNTPDVQKLKDVKMTVSSPKPGKLNFS